MLLKMNTICIAGRNESCFLRIIRLRIGVKVIIAKLLMSLLSDINECERSDLCSPHGECLNTDGSYQCICEQGFSVSADGRTCEGETSHSNS